jgi:glutaconate CoA-transferase subunit B
MSETSKSTDYTRAELCIVAAAEAWRDAGEVLASGLGVVPRLAASLAKCTFSPDLLMTDSECMLVSEPVPPGPRRGYQIKVEGWLPFRKVFDLLWSGRRHAMTMPTQIDRYGAINISYIGTDPKKPKAQLLGVRGIPGNTINHPSSFFVQKHSTRAFVERVDMASGVSFEPSRWREGVRSDFVDLRLVVSDLAVLDFGGAGRTMRLKSLHPGVTVDQVREQTGFELALATEVTETPTPTPEQLRWIREVLDPNDLRAGVFPS